MKKILSTGALVITLLTSQTTILAEVTKITQEKAAQILEKRLVEICLKVFSIVRELPQLDTVMQQVQQKKQTIEMTMMTRGMNKQKIELLNHTVIEKIMKGIELDEIVKTVSSQPQYAPMKDLVAKFTDVLDQMLTIMVTASSAQEELKVLNKDAKKIRDEFIATGKTEEEVIAIIQDIMKQIQEQFEKQEKVIQQQEKTVNAEAITT
ncbi:hypothetical protein KC460_03080 [Candidatus Dependentiae bacterium]|nr:hypothetical protein [Candidatus Dependentiae bacterium]